MTKYCPQCDRKFDNDQYRFCIDDGTELIVIATPDTPSFGDTNSAEPPIIIDGGRWIRRPGEFAVRIEAEELRALFDRVVVVEEGMAGLLFQNGKMIGTLTAGQHAVESVFDRIKNLVIKTPVSVVLIDNSIVGIPVSLPNLKSSDDQHVSGAIQVLIELSAPVTFCTDVMKNEKVFRIDDLASRLRPWVKEAVEPIVWSLSASEFATQPELRERIELDLLQGLPERLARLGLSIRGVDHVQFHCAAQAQIQEKRSELSRQEALEEINQAYQQLRHRLSTENARMEMRKLKGQAEMSQFVKRLEHEVFRRDLLRQHEREELTRQLLERREDHDGQRAHALATLELTRQAELSRLKHQFQVEDIRADHEARVLSLQSEGELNSLAGQQQRDELEQELTADLQRADLAFQMRQKHNRETFDWALYTRKANEELNLALAAQQQQQELANAQAGIELYAQYKTAKQTIEHKDRLLEADLQAAQEQARHQHEMDRARTFNELTPEALIAMSPENQAALLADLRKTETLKDMDEGQIMALFAKDSPEIAKALGEKFSAAGVARSQQQAQEMYERMLADKDAMLAMFQSMHRETMKSQQELAQFGMQTQRDTAVSTAQASGPAPIVFPPTTVAPHFPDHVATGPASAFCPECQLTSPMNSKFCLGCGKPFAS
ncbi:MAG: hypothetical protein KDA83_13010 [Planctomycetales bacterium]|nr:hypothetical protein [Planctomycetales bacterium]